MIIETGTSKYIVDFGKLLETEDARQKMSTLLAMNIQASNIQPDLVVDHHLVRIEPEKPHQREYYLAKAVAENLDLPHTTYYEQQNTEIPSFIRGVSPRGRITIVDGAVRTGNTLLRTVDYLRQYNEVNVEDVFVIMLRPEGQKRKELNDRLKKANIRLHYLITGKEMATRLRKSNYLNKKEYQEVLADEDFYGQKLPLIERIIQPFQSNITSF